MSVPEYAQRAEDHRSILLLVRRICGLNETSDVTNDKKNATLFDQLFEKINRIEEIKIKEPNLGYERTVRLRFKKNDYDPSNNDWGDFQAHRRLFGVITFGQLNDDEQEEEEFYERHLRSVEKYTGLYDSRCFLVRPVKNNQVQASKVLPEVNTKAGQSSLEQLDRSENIICDDVNSQTPITLKASHLNIIEPNNNGTGDEDHYANTENSINNSISSISSRLANFSVHEFDLNNVDQKKELDKLVQLVEHELQGLVASIFYVLESKRLDKSFEKQERVPLLMAPFEAKSLAGVDSDAKQFRKKCLARMRKHVGDLCLLIGSPCEALTNYSSAIELLRINGDLLWLSGALEGQCVASLCLLYPNSPTSDLFYMVENGHSNGMSSLKKRSSLQRLFSLPANKGRNQNGAEGKSEQLQENQAKINESSNQTTPNNQPSNVTTSTDSSNRNVRSNLTKRFGTSGNSTKSLPSGIDPIMSKMLGKALLSTPEEIYEKYKEACCHYAKFKPAAVVELECSFKAARVLASREKYLQAADFIQNAVFIFSDPNLDEQIRRLSVIASLYEEIGFRRKSSFYRRFSALKTISSNLEKANWQRGYYLLLPALPGYHLTLDPLEYCRRIKQKDFGWIGIHIQLLQELITMSRRMNQERLALRHLSFLLQCLFEHLQPQMRCELAKQLKALSASCGEDMPVTLTLENGIQIPCVNLTKFPLVTRFEILNAVDHLRPYKIKSKQRECLSNPSPSSPFIFTPMQINRPLHARRKSQSANQVQTLDFQWVQNEPCFVQLEVYNPLSLELNVNQFALMTSDSSSFETHETSMKLASEAGPVKLQLSGKPFEAGKLEIIGYTTHVLGVKNYCKLADLPAAKRLRMPNKYIVDVIPSLPLLEIEYIENMEKTSEDFNFPSLVECSDESSSETAKKLKDEKILNSSNSQKGVPEKNIFLRMYAGQTKKCKIKLSNASSGGQLIELVNLKVTSDMSAQLQDEMIKFNVDEILQHLPFDSEKQIELNLSFFAQSDFTKELNKKKSIPNSRPDSPVSYPNKKQPNSIGSTLANFLSDLQSTPKSKRRVMPEAKKVITPPSQSFSSKKYHFTFEFEYSGGGGLAAGYCRKRCLIFTIEIVPSLIITQWDVLPGEVDTHCYLVFDVLNANSREMELQYSENKSIVIEPKETCRIPVPVQRCPRLSQEEISQKLSSMRLQSIHPIRGNESNVPTDAKHALHLLCKKHLLEQVQLTWKLAQVVNKQKLTGSASIETIPWTQKMLNHILMSSLSWKICINDIPFTDFDELSFAIGEIVRVRVEMLNCCAWKIKYINLMLDCYQDYQNNNRRYNLDQKRGIIGKDRIHIEQLASKQSFIHEIRYVFFYSGVYKLDIHCNGTESSSYINSNESTQSSTWAYSPSIELCIRE